MLEFQVNILNVCYGALGSYCLVFTQENHCIVLYAQITMTKATVFDLAVYNPSSETRGQSRMYKASGLHLVATEPRRANFT